MVSDVVTVDTQTGTMFFAYCHEQFNPDANPSLLGWFVDRDDIWTVAILVDGQLVFVTGPARREDPLAS